MASPDELRADIARARDELREVLRTVETDWEKEPAGGEGEDAWLARQTAEHVVRAEVFYARIVSSTCEREAPENPWASPTGKLASSAEYASR
ncbi:MAG: hypothetical protein O3C25_00065 [Chloroflexi bacterium]|nr:hypothetical protein [Chloroflexota bacterium]